MTPLVFISAPSSLTSDQEALLGRWTAVLAERGLALERLKRREYASNPWGQLRTILSGVDAVLVCGFRQLHVNAGIWRPDTVEEEDVAARQWTSPWLHIEAGMAVMLGLPVLLAPERGVTEGAFCAEAWKGPVFGSPLDDGPEGSEVVKWRAELDLRFSSRRLRR